MWIITLRFPFPPPTPLLSVKTHTRFILGQVCAHRPLQSGRKRDEVLLRSKQKMPVVTFKLLLWWKVQIAAIKWAFDPKIIIDLIKISGFASSEENNNWASLDGRDNGGISDSTCQVRPEHVGRGISLVAHKGWDIGFAVAEQSRAKPIGAAASRAGKAGAVPGVWSAKKSCAGWWVLGTECGYRKCLHGQRMTPLTWQQTNKQTN